MLDFAWIKCMDIALGMGESFDLGNESTLVQSEEGVSVHPPEINF